MRREERGEEYEEEGRRRRGRGYIFHMMVTICHTCSNYFN